LGVVAARAARITVCMRKFLVIASVLASTCTVQAESMSRSFYDERGSFAGSSVTRGKSTSFYDKQGRFSGTALNYGRSTSFYDGRGRFTGSVVNTGPRR
jgi:hypothetical protein